MRKPHRSRPDLGWMQDATGPFTNNKQVETGTSRRMRPLGYSPVTGGPDVRYRLSLMPSLIVSPSTRPLAIAFEAAAAGGGGGGDRWCRSAGRRGLHLAGAGERCRGADAYPDRHADPHPPRLPQRARPHPPTPPHPRPRPRSTGRACYLPGDGNCGPYAYSRITNSNGYNTYVGIQLWGCGAPGSCGPETLTAYNPGQWSVTSRRATLRC